MSLPVQNKTAALTLKLRRICGSFLKQIKREKGGRPKNTGCAGATSFQEAVDQSGIDRTNANRWQKLTDISEAEIDKKAEMATAQGQDFSMKLLLEEQKNQERESGAASSARHGVSDPERVRYRQRRSENRRRRDVPAPGFPDCRSRDRTGEPLAGERQEHSVVDGRIHPSLTFWRAADSGVA